MAGAAGARMPTEVVGEACVEWLTGSEDPVFESSSLYRAARPTGAAG